MVAGGFRLLGLAFVFALLCCRASYASDAHSDAASLQKRIVAIFEEKRSAVVRVKAAYSEDSVAAKKRVTLRVGTGFFFSKDGHIAVSASRALGASRVWIEYEGRTYAAEAIGHDALTNISILKLLELPDSFSILSIDPGTKLPEVGSFIVAVSCPLDFDPTPIVGTVSGYDKKLGNKVFPTEYIRSSIGVDGGQGGCPFIASI